GQRRIDFQWNRRGSVLPRDVGAVGHREIGLVIAGDRLLAPQDEAWLCRFLTQAAGEHLIHADAALKHCALLKGRAREDSAGLPRMDTYAGSVLVEQTGDDV